ncbi:histidinol-phosphate transaminase [Aliifodinibius salipaludis]|uniref:Histidinol-phosphate aminotransferase n=1 Tax=Fodinibius salipaludis TaxID=2032627 RepID=A0A2A2G9I4_9BACT|nr:histidinol-phosphate transaminase [Aliifodinibius salipaludis]PAU93664.1 histidinol-phosphate transaminase [Aliifodinibius salipaludis]
MNRSFDLEKLVRPNIKKLVPYHSAREDFGKGLLLDANENSLGAPFPDDQQLHRYPDPKQTKLRELIAEWRGVRAQNVFTGVGSDEGIDLLYRIFCQPGQDRVLTTPPTYGMYNVSANIHDIAVDEVLLDEEDFQPPADKILEAVKPNTKILFLCSPNNPTGNTFKPEKIRTLVENFRGIVILDEAYIDFSDQESWASKIADYPNLVVLQTLSKSFGLAGIRLGITYAQEDIINYMMKVKAPYNINKLTAEKAIDGLQNWETVQFRADAIKKERKQLADKLKQLKIVHHVYESDANFLLTKFTDAREVYNQLAEQYIIIRYRGDQPHCENCLRITVGTPDENERLISALKKLG